MTSEGKVAELKTPPKMGGSVEDPRARDLDIIKKDIARRPFHIKFDLNDTEYQPIEKIGIGAYGVVCSATHKKTSDKVAIKKIPCVFDALAIAKRTYREIKILKHFKHDNIISIREILKPKESFQEFRDIYVVFDLMESDLHRIIYSEQPLTEEHIRYFLYQILRGLKYIHSANVVHRDLKPSNLLVNEDCHVRVGDFGMARGVNSQQEEPSHYMTQYVATRWYRAPEILLSMLEYGTAVDMWSVGCIFAEMLGRKHLFPGKDYLSQVRLVLEVLGTPSEAVLKDCQNDVLKRIIRSLNHHEPMPWSKLYPKVSRKALDLLGKMLVLNPAHRITVETALKHPFLSKYHDPDDEPICVPSFEFDFEKELVHMDRDHLRGVIYKEIMDFHQPRTPTLSFLACLRPVPKEDVCGEGGQGPPTTPPAFRDQLQALMAAATVAGTAAETTTDNTAAGAVTQEAVLATSQGSEMQVVFKKPETRPVTKKSPVSVDTSSLKLPATADVEMLSAQSVDSSKLMETQTLPNNLKDGNKEVKTGDTHKVKENKTISADTKALVKQALLSHRQRTESCGEEEKPRPVTAAQRQREREEKRKKKQDKKMKRMQDKKSLPAAPELSEADRELLARWSSMQKKPDSHQPIMPKPPQHTVCATTTTVTVVCLPQGIAAGPLPGNLGLSSSQSAPTSTTPSILPKGLLPPGQLTILTTTPLQGGQGQIIIQSGQILGLQTVSFGLDTGSLPTSVSPQQGQTTFSSQQGLQLSYPDVSVMSLAEVQCQPGGQLHITETQAQALKETLRVNLAQDPAKRESGGFELTGPFQTYASPPQTPPQVQRNSSCGQFRNDPSQSPHHESSPFYSHQSPHSFTPSPNPENAGDGIYFQASAQSQLSSTGMVTHQSQQATTSLASNQTNMGNHQSRHSNSSLVSHPPQNLSEFLDRHCCEPAKVEAAESVGDLKDFQADSVSTGMVSYLGKVTMSGTGLPNFVQPKAEQAALGSGYFSSPQHHQQSAEFEDVKIVPQITDNRLNFSRQQAAVTHFTNHCQNTVGFSGDKLSGLPFSSQGVNRNVSGVPYSVQQSCRVASIPTCQPYFVPADPTYVTSMRDNSVPFHLTAVMDDGSLPFSRYSHPQNLQSFQVSNEENLQAGFGLPSLTHSLSSAYHSDADNHASHTSYSSHPNIGQAARHPTIPSQSLSHIHHHHPHQQVPAAQELVNLSSSNFCLQPEAQYQSQQLHHQQPPPLTHNPHHHHQQQQLHHHHLQQLQLPLTQDPNHPQQHDQHLYHHQLQQQHSHSPEAPHHHQQQQLPHQQQQQPPSSQQDLHQQQAGAPHLQPATQSQNQTSSGRLGPGDLRVSAPKPDSQGVDLVAMLSSKLSNILPPSLSLTPRGTGAGYGVGMDLDVLMAESVEPINSRLFDMSPLSSSLLADWLEVTRNISQSDLDALEQDFGMTSPMAISYSELSTPNPSASSNSTGNNNCGWLQ